VLLRAVWALALPLALSLPETAPAQPLGAPPVPPSRLETKPPRPASERIVWQQGTWEWDAAAERYTWRAGRHVVRRPGTTRYVPGRWVQTAGEWSWRRARWR